MVPSIVLGITTVILVDDDDKLDYVRLTYNEVEDNFWSTWKQNSTLVINKLKIQSCTKFWLHIPLSPLVSIPLVRSTMHSDVKLLKAAFAHGIVMEIVFFIPPWQATLEKRRLWQQRMKKGGDLPGNKRMKSLKQRWIQSRICFAVGSCVLCLGWEPLIACLVGVY